MAPSCRTPGCSHWLPLGRSSPPQDHNELLTRHQGRVNPRSKSRCHKAVENAAPPSYGSAYAGRAAANSPGSSLEGRAAALRFIVRHGTFEAQTTAGRGAMGQEEKQAMLDALRETVDEEGGVDSELPRLNVDLRRQAALN